MLTSLYESDMGGGGGYPNDIANLVANIKRHCQADNTNTYTSSNYATVNVPGMGIDQARRYTIEVFLNVYLDVYKNWYEKEKDSYGGSGEWQSKKDTLYNGSSGYLDSSLKMIARLNSKGTEAEYKESIENEYEYQYVKKALTVLEDFRLYELTKKTETSKIDDAKSNVDRVQSAYDSFVKGVYPDGIVVYNDGYHGYTIGEIRNAFTKQFEYFKMLKGNPSNTVGMDNFNENYTTDLARFYNACEQLFHWDDFNIVIDAIALKDDAFDKKYVQSFGSVLNRDWVFEYAPPGTTNTLDKGSWQMYYGSSMPYGFILVISQWMKVPTSDSAINTYSDAANNNHIAKSICAILTMLSETWLDDKGVDRLHANLQGEIDRAQKEVDDLYAAIDKSRNVYIDDYKKLLTWNNGEKNNENSSLNSVNIDIEDWLEKSNSVYGSSYEDYVASMAGEAVTSDYFVTPLAQELIALEGIHGQHPETGAGVGNDVSYIRQYTNRIFGAPYQLLDSVDRRFPDINPRLGTEYLRNFILNGPILHIKPGMPLYTGGDKNTAEKLLESFQKIYMDTTQGDMDIISSILGEMAQSIVFDTGHRLQRRLYGFRENYYDYMQHVNYMCRSMAVFLNLTSDPNTTGYPNGTFVGEDETTVFTTMNWEDYRMMSSSKTLSPSAYLQELIGSTFVGAIYNTGKSVAELISEWINPWSTLKPKGDDVEAGDWLNYIGMTASDAWKDITSAWSNAADYHMSDKLVDKICSVQFLVEPGSFNETINNTTEQSALESAQDSIGDIGAEIAWISNTGSDTGVVESMVHFLGSALDTAVTSLTDIMKSANITNGFIGNFLSGTLSAIKGQKMIYPEIYKRTTTSMNYEFTINLSSPYGDVYNYYMNIVVPLMHLVALAAPRMVTSNTTSSPYLVQAFIPGMCTCQLGIIENMSIIKNPNANRVSVNGFPLDIQVKFTVKELYNALSISPANDPAAFLFNETLNDYMANLAGLMPSIDTYTQQREVMFSNMTNYIMNGGLMQDMAAGAVAKIEDIIDPYIGR